MERQGEDLGHAALGVRQSRQGAAARDHVRMLVAGQGVVERERQSQPQPLGQHPLPLGRFEPHHIEVVAVAPVGAIARQHHSLVLQPGAVPGGHLAAALDLLSQAGQLAQQHPGLELIEAAVDAELHGLALAIPAIEAAAARRLHSLGPVDHQGAAIAEGRQVLGGVEAEGGEMAPGAHGPLAVGGAAGLGAILDQGNTVLLAEAEQRHQIAGLPIAVHGDHGTHRPLPIALRRSGPQQGRHMTDGEHGAPRLKIHEHRPGLEPQHGGGGGIGGVGGQQHPITGAHAGGAQGQLKGIGAVGHADHLLGGAAGTQPGGERRLELPHPLAEDHLTGSGDPLHGVGHEVAVTQELLLGEVEGIAHGGAAQGRGERMRETRGRAGGAKAQM